MPRQRRGFFQPALFPRPERLRPEMASPSQFAKLPGILWHGNFDASSVNQPFNALADRSHWSDNPVGVHAGTRRSAMDRLDALGPYTPEANLDESDVPLLSPSERRRIISERGGEHGFLHPVLPPRGRIAAGLREDAGNNWSEATIGANPDLRKDDAWRYSTSWDVQRGLRYQNAQEHPGTHSALIPVDAPMQHSDYVAEALRQGRPVHPLTRALYERGVLDESQARKYEPLSAGRGAPSVILRGLRTRTVKELRKRPTIDGQMPLIRGPWVVPQQSGSTKKSYTWDEP